MSAVVVAAEWLYVGSGSVPHERTGESRGLSQSYRKVRVVFILLVSVENMWELGDVVQSVLFGFRYNVGKLKTT